MYPQLNNAGTERVIFNLYENIDREKVQFDFLVEKQGGLDNRISELGGCIHYLTKESSRDYYLALINFFKFHPEYKIVHTHTHARMSIVLKAAKKCGVKCRIAHSHNSRNDLPAFAWFIKGMTSISIERNANVFFACSQNAAHWLFRHKYKQCRIINNGIDMNKYKFSSVNRELHRHKLGIREDEFVIINVGRFARQKNHIYLVNVLKELDKLALKPWRVIFVGDGPLKDEIINKMTEYNLLDKAVFLGNRVDVDELYSAADLFILPSLHEGLGIVVVEAQANGLKCLVSEAIPDEADIGKGLVHQIFLREGTKKWARMMNDFLIDTNCSRYIDDISDLDINNISKQIQEFYIEHAV